MGTLEVCAVVYSPKINCPIQLSFNVTLSTVPGTASELTVLPKQYQQGLYFHFSVPVLDYHALVSTVLAFNVCEIRKCIEVTIENDRTPENNESIYHSLP